MVRKEKGMKKRQLTAPKPATSRSIDEIDPYVCKGGMDQWMLVATHTRAHTTANTQSLLRTK